MTSKFRVTAAWVIPAAKFSDTCLSFFMPDLEHEDAQPDDGQPDAPEPGNVQPDTQ